MNTLDSILDGIKIKQQETIKKQDSYLDDVSIFDFSNALQFANQSNNFSYDAIQNNSNDIISQNSVSATPYEPASKAQDHSYQKSLDEAASKYNLNKNSNHNKESHSFVDDSKEYSKKSDTTVQKSESKEPQISKKEEASTQEIRKEEVQGKEDTKVAQETQEAKLQSEAKVDAEAKKVQVDTKLLEKMDTKVSAEDTKQAKELLKLQEADVEAESEEKEVKAEVKAQEKEVKLEAKVEVNVKAQEKVQVEAKAIKDSASNTLSSKQNLEAKVEVEEVDLKENPEVDLAIEADTQGEEEMFLGQKQEQNFSKELRGKSSALPSEVAFSNASKRAAFNRVFNMAQPKSLEESNILNQVIRKVSEKIAQNNTKISISLTPDRLGKIDVDFIQGKNGITAQITAENSQVKEVLSKNLNSLRDSLASHGVSVSNINIKVEKAEESNDANFNLNKEQDFDMGQQGEQAGNSNFADEGNQGNKTAYGTSADMSESLEADNSAEQENKPSLKHEHSTVEYQA